MPVIIRKHVNSGLYTKVTNANLIRQIDFLRLSFDIAKENGFLITIPFIQDLHRHAMVYLVDSPGMFREEDVEIRGASHQPPTWDKVDRYMREFIGILQRNWNVWDEIQLAAFSMWRLNWIHPFMDGNGRTARALTYFILCCKSHLWLPGENTVMQQLRNDRVSVFQALASADVTNLDNHNSENFDLLPLESKIEQMVRNQLDSARSE